MNGSEQMKKFGIRQAKAHLSQLVRAAAAGECSLVTDNRKPVAMIGPPPVDSVEAEALPPPADYGMHTFRSVHPFATAWKYSQPLRMVIGPGGFEEG